MFPRLRQQCFRRSMRKSHAPSGSNNGAPLSTWGYHALLVLCGLLCISGLHCVGGEFTCPTNCTCGSIKIGGDKFQDISCVEKGLVDVPSDDKEGADVLYLDLSGNLIPSLQRANLTYFTALESLNLSNNPISSLPSDVFDDLTNLQFLNLAAISLSTLPSGIFDSLTSLVSLNLTGNTLTTLTTDVFDPLTSLVSLDISSMSLTELDKDLLKYLDNLEEVVINNNQISQLHQNVFKKNDLLYIDLSGNQLEEAKFKLKRELITLNVSNNIISTVDKSFLNDADSLTNLDMSSNQITSLDKKSFEDAPDLLYLNLSNNLLSTLEADLFQENTGLQHLNLSANSLTTLPTNVFERQTVLQVDLTDNPFVCDCNVRNMLYALDYDENQEVLSKDSTTCTESGTNYVYFDWDDASCTGNLGDSCTTVTDCMVRHSACTVDVCRCEVNYYDNNNLTTYGGQCKPKVQLDYPCDIDDACETLNAECKVSATSTSTDKNCFCENSFYDDTPLFLGGLCLPQLSLGGECTMNSMCKTVNAECSGGFCTCLQPYYPGYNDSSEGQECYPKIALHASCNETYQCASDNAECSSNICACSAGYYDVDGIGECKGPDNYFSCYLSDEEVHFSHVINVTSLAECESECFKKNARYRLKQGIYCLCGAIKTPAVCCPKVEDSCQGRNYLAEEVDYVTSRMQLAEPLRKGQTGVKIDFILSTNLSAIDLIIWKFNDTNNDIFVNGNSSTISHTFTYAGLFSLTMSGCYQANNVCDVNQISLPIQGHSAYITGSRYGSTNECQSTYATFTRGYNLPYKWSLLKPDKQISKSQDCPIGWSAHKNTCTQLFTTRATYAAAVSSCGSFGGTLLTFNYLDEIEPIVTLLGGIDNVMVGLTNVGGLVMFNGVKTRFHESDLLDASNGECLALDVSVKRLTSTNCLTEQNYACMIDPVDCPKGGELLDSGYCLVLETTKQTWENAKAACSSVFNGWLANITDDATHTIAAKLLNDSSLHDAYFGLNDNEMEGLLMWGDNSRYDYHYTPSLVEDTDHDCYLTTNTKTWKSVNCNTMAAFICQYSQNIEHVTVEERVIGTKNLNIPADLKPLSPASTSFSASVETNLHIMLYQGSCFLHEGFIREWVFCTEILAANESYDISFLVLEPQCSSGSLVQADCEVPPSCNATGTEPTYEMAGKTDVIVSDVDAGEHCYVVKAADIPLSTNSVIGFQAPKIKSIIKTVTSHPENHTSYKVPTTGYGSKPYNIQPSLSDFLDNTTLYVQAIYSQEIVKNLSQNLACQNEDGDYEILLEIIEGVSYTLNTTLEEKITDVILIYPEETQPGIAHIAVNETINLTICAKEGTSLKSLISVNGDANQSPAFGSMCPADVNDKVGQSCNTSLIWSDAPFASISVTLSTIGSQPVKVILNNNVDSFAFNFTLVSEVEIKNFTFTLVQNSSIIPNTVAVNSLVLFISSTTGGSNLNFAYNIDGAQQNSTSEILYYTFGIPGTYSVAAVVENHVSSENASVTVNAKIPADFTNCNFPKSCIAAANVPFALEFQCDVALGSEVNMIWNANNNKTIDAVTTTTSTKQSWTYLLTFPSVTVNGTVTATANDSFGQVTESVTCDVFDVVPSVHVSASALESLVFVNITFELNVNGTGIYGPLTFTCEFGDGTTDSSASNVKTHAYASRGDYTVIITASNDVSNASTTVVIQVQEPLNETEVTTYGAGWLNNVGTSNWSSCPVIPLGQSAWFQILTTPSENKTRYNLTIEGLPPVISNTSIIQVNFSTIGKWIITATAFTSLSNSTSEELTIFTIRDITSITATANGDPMSNDTTYVKCNNTIEIGVDSSDIVENTVSYYYILKENGVLAGSSHNTTMVIKSTTAGAVYQLRIIITTTLGAMDFTYSIRSICPISNLAVSAPYEEDTYIPLNGTLILMGSADGNDPQYMWYFLKAPEGQTLPNVTSNSVTVRPTAVGEYIVRLECHNNVTSVVYANYTFEVQEEVTNPVIHFLNNTVLVNSMETYTVTANGTNITFIWQVTLSGVVVSNGTNQTFSFLFGTQAVYNISVLSSNNLNNVTAYVEINSQNYVPLFDLVATPSSLVNTTNLTAVPSNTNVTIASTLVNFDFLTLTWTVNETEVGNSTILIKSFSSVGLYVVKLVVTNKLGSQANVIYIMVEEPIANLSVAGCNESFLVGALVTLTASHEGSFGITSWQIENKPNTAIPPTGSVTTISGLAKGNYSMNINVKNNVSEETKNCHLTILGKISNLTVSLSQYQYVGYNITFIALCDNNEFATFVFTFSDNSTVNITESSLNKVFATPGNHTVSVLAWNAISSETVEVGFTVNEVLCAEPELSASSTNLTCLQGFDCLLEVDVNTGNCIPYESKYTWVVIEGTCQENPASVTEVPLPSDIITNTSVLSITKKTLGYGSYCARFNVSYTNTPVVQYFDINVNIQSSPLNASISGGHEVSVNAGDVLSVTVEVYDSDEVSNQDPNLLYTYNWDCNVLTYASSAATAAEVCSAINAISTSSASLTGLTLTEGDVYEVIVNVFKKSDGATTTAIQKLTSVGPSAPKVEAKCVGCDAYNNHNKLVPNVTITFIVYCLSGCDDSTIFIWSVTEVSTSTTMPIGSTESSTGVNRTSFTLKPGVLHNDKEYKFNVNATTPGNGSGFSSATYKTASVPYNGTCSVSDATDGSFPLSNVTCLNWADTDSNSSQLYYTINVCKPPNEYTLYEGVRSAVTIPLPSCAGTDEVEISVIVSNVYGSSILANRRTIQYPNTPNDMDWIVEQIIKYLKAIVKEYNPSKLVQYCIAVLGLVNEQSATSHSSVEQRMAVRKIIAVALSGIPTSTRADILLLGNALEDLSEYAEEIADEVLAIVIDKLENLISNLDSTVQQYEGIDGIQTECLFRTIDNILGALNLNQSSFADNATLNKLGPLSNYVFSGSNQTSANLREISREAVSTWAIDLTLLQLKAMAPKEDPVTNDEIGGFAIIGNYSDANEFSQIYKGNRSTLVLAGSILQQVHYDRDLVFQIVYEDTEIVYDDNGNSNSMKTPAVGASFFNDGSGLPVSVTNLASGNEVCMYMFTQLSNTSYDIPDSGLSTAPDYNPTEHVNYTTKEMKGDKRYKVALSVSQGTQGDISIQVIPHYNNSYGQLTVSVNINGTTFSEKVITFANLSDHTEYSFFIPNGNGNTAIELILSSTSGVNVSFGAFASTCLYYNTVTLGWATDGCTATVESIPSVIHCCCNHMTTYGGSMLVSPDQISFTDLTDLDIANNPVAIITCSVVLFVYIVVAIICRRMDIVDVNRISLIPLCGKDGSFKYEVTVVTGRQPGAGTTGNVGIRIVGEYGKSVRQHISKNNAFQRCCSDTFIIAYDVNLGDLKKVSIWHDNTGLSPSWYLSHVIVYDMQTDQKYYFFANTWLSLEVENGTIQKELNVAGAEEMQRFGHRMKTAMFNALADKHLWLSLMNRPAQSRFTRLQRITCCITLLYTFAGVNAMWYGLLKTENSTFGFGSFGWEEIVLAIVSNLMVIPINIGLVFLFKKSRSKSNFFARVQKPQTAQTLEIENLCGNSQGGSFESQNTGAIPYDLERESTLDSIPPHNVSLGLHRSRHVAHTHREQSDDNLYKGPRVAVTHATAKAPLWNEENIMKWPESMSFDDGADSRPSTSSTVRGPAIPKQPPAKAGGSTPGVTRKSKTLKSKADSDKLLEDLDQMEQELKEVESKSVKSSGSRRSSLRKPSMQRSNWGSLEDILHSDDESVAESGKRFTKKRDSSSGTRKFNPRSDPRIQNNGANWPKSRESIMSATTNRTNRQTGGITDGLRPGYYNEMTMESHDIHHHPVNKEKCTLPSWCVYIAYVLCFLLSAFSVIMVILYCFEFGYDESVEWVLAFILSLILSVFVIETLKALLIAIYVVAAFKNVEQDVDDDFIDIEPTFDNTNERIKEMKFKPISGFALLQAKEEGQKIHRMNLMIRQFVAYIFYLWLVMVVVYVNFQYSSYLLNKHVENNFVNVTTTDDVCFNNMSSIDEFWDWTENVFAESLHLQDILTDEEHGYLLGPARLRLIRSTTSKCQVSEMASSIGASTLTDRTCYGDGGFEEDTSFYGERWNDSSYNRSWKYNWASELGGSHKIGHLGTYSGGGYTQVLGTSQLETLTIIQDLKDKQWIDLRTRAVVFEFSIYSPGSDMTAMCAFLAEFPLTGGVITSYEVQSQKLLWFQENKVDPLMVLECILLLVIIYSLVHIVLQIRQKGKQFFKDLWSWYEMLTTLMTVVAIGMYIGCVVEATNTFNNYLDNQTGFTNFERVMYVHVGMRYLNAWLLFLLMYKVVKQLRFIKFLYIYEKTLSSAVGHLLGTGLIYIILLLIYAQLGYLMYGRMVSGFESVGHSITTLVVMIRGTFNFWPMLDHHPIFSHFYVYSYYAFVYGIMIALVISILTSTYRITKSQMYYKSTLEMQDYEMIDFMMKRFKLWAGIQKPKPAFRRVRFPGLPSVSSRSSSSYSNRSSVSLQSAQSISSPEFSQVQLNSMLTRLVPTWQAVLRRFEKIEALDKEEENLVKKAEDGMKDLNWKCRINELERQHKDILSWKNQPQASSSNKPPIGDAKQRQSILKRLANQHGPPDRKAPATVSGAERSAATPPVKDDKITMGKRPLSDQGARTDQNKRTSTPEKSKIRQFLKSVRPSKDAWNK